MNPRFTALFPALMVLAACAQGPAAQPPAPPPPAVGGNCNAQAAQFAVGRPFDAALQEEVRTRSGARVARVIRPNDMVTMDYSDQRVNIELDAAGRVAKVRCG